MTKSTRDEILAGVGLLVVLVVIFGGLIWSGHKSKPIEERPDFIEWNATHDMTRCERAWYHVVRNGETDEWPEGQAAFMADCEYLEPAVP